jgi:hypothetical protein
MADSSLMPFVYIINKTNGNGTMSDAEGKFTLQAKDADTVVAAYIGFFKQQVPANKLQRKSDGTVRIVMQPMPVDLREVQVTAFRIKPYEREYMSDIIDKSRIRPLDLSRSPITALYMQYSKEGRQLRKLARIFEQLLIEEKVEKKLNRDILAKLTGDNHIDYESFRRYCYYITDDFIINHEGVELYSRIMDCYGRYKLERPR